MITSTKKTGRIRMAVISRRKMRAAAKVLAVSLMLFLISGAELFDGALLCCAPLTAVLISNDKQKLYLIPVVLAGVITTCRVGIPAIGDISATLICMLIFLAFRRGSLNVLQRAFLVVGIMLICNGIIFYLAHMFYRFLTLKMVEKSIFTFFMCLAAQDCFGLLNGRRGQVNTFDSNFFEKKAWQRRTGEVYYQRSMASCAFLFSIAFAGTGSEEILMFGGFFLAMFMGSFFGTGEGTVAGTVSGMVACAAGIFSFSAIGLLAAAGLISGVMKNLGRAVSVYVSAVGVILIAFSTGHLQAESNLYCLAAAVICVIIFPGDAAERFLRYQQNAGTEQGAIEQKLIDEIYEYAGIYRQFFNACRDGYGENTQAACFFRTAEKGLEELGRIHTASFSRDGRNCPEKYSFDAAGNSFAATGKVCGDSRIILELDNGLSMMVISDGMGRGPSASVISKMVVKMVAGYAKMGVMPEMILKTINALMADSGEERLATIDLCIFDKCTGMAKLYKTGAAPTFVRRKGRVSVIEMEALPLGIIKGIPIKHKKIHLRNQDVLVMISDGVTECAGNDPEYSWIKQVISDISSKDPQTISGSIMRKAIKKYGIAEKDDITVMAAGVTM